MTSSDAPAHVRHLVVEGRVQGVGFRWFVRERARRLSLKGWVRNRQDGSVEILVAGAVSMLDHLVRALEGGPPGAQVHRVRDLSSSGAPDVPTAEGTVPDKIDAGATDAAATDAAATDVAATVLPYPFVILR